MWIFFPHAMLSVVAHRTKPRHLLVRARFKGDLERVFPGRASEVKRTPDADYLYRVEVTRGELAHALADHVEWMTYTNVKGAVPAGDVRRKAAMGEVWEAMYAAQHAAEPVYAAAAPLDAVPLDIRTDDLFQHTTARGHSVLVRVHQVQERLEDEPLVSLQYSPSGKRYSIPMSRAQAWLRDAEMVP